MMKRPKGIEPGSAGSAAACAISIDSDDDPDRPPPKAAKQQQELMLGVSRMTTTMGDYVSIARQQLESSKQQEKLLNTMISVDMENTKYTKLTANRVSANKGNLIG